jgi:hypothetical protein
MSTDRIIRFRHDDDSLVERVSSRGVAVGFFLPEVLSTMAGRNVGKIMQMLTFASLVKHRNNAESDATR